MQTLSLTLAWFYDLMPIRINNHARRTWYWIAPEGGSGVWPF
jgi:hypothetical protein